MPGTDGFTRAELMRGSQRTRHIPISLRTADPGEQHRVFRGYDAGAVDFLVKPIEPVILRNKAEVFFQLERQRQELSSTLRLAETFMAAVGHDLKNPLHAMLTGAELIAMRSSDPEAQRVAARVKSSGMRMASIIEDLFDLSRARLAGGIPIVVRHVDLRTLVERAVGEHEATSAPSVIRLQHEGRLDGQWDETRLAQVVSNLVGNAIRHGKRGAPIDVSLREIACDRVALTVHNLGSIPPEILPHVFDPFRSSASPDRRPDGLGLGLYIVREIVLAHRGHIEVHSTEEAGTTFRVELPRHAADPSEG
jgi:two-component system sensor histidine kinase/response regulator